ncbi:hypothetical protein ARMGADRAFT_775803 [Armillaria gallica]|uniref:Uncharacterized protein n=1 Tax=Armillaria gallica TaxID=47427 RepID=A0A2H3CF27_ARMGA|nr:hypothetical protein ARMGADRAFT_775803 [Armillaria gallica]
MSKCARDECTYHPRAHLRATSQSSLTLPSTSTSSSLSLTTALCLLAGRSYAVSAPSWSFRLSVWNPGTRCRRCEWFQRARTDWDRFSFKGLRRRKLPSDCCRTPKTYLHCALCRTRGIASRCMYVSYSVRPILPGCKTARRPIRCPRSISMDVSTRIRVAKTTHLV